ncbi:MAG: bifunctional 4-hydroxy-2-oxoglutarate aldolase/2-dehydro-3-deoxy-phosphogluconate aldolase [Alphaproteobacteria bacterium]
MNHRSKAIETILTRAPVIPVLAVDDPSIAADLAHTLVKGGLPVIEVTLRSSRAIDVLRTMAKVEDAIVGAGTVLTEEQAKAAINAGAKFLVSPGATEALLDSIENLPVPLLPGAVTASEIMHLIERDYRFLKFFPAEPMGGVALLKAFMGPFPHVKFCPTGGIDLAKAKTYLALENVVCVGGSFVTPDTLIAARDWGKIHNLAKEASQY